MNSFDELEGAVAANLELRKVAFEKEVQSQHYQQEIRNLITMTQACIGVVKSISFYSTRAKKLYDEFLTIRASDDLIQSILAIYLLISNGIHNMTKREIRYLLEMTVKYLYVDQTRPEDDISAKIGYLRKEVPRSSISVVEKIWLPFDPRTNKQFKDEVRDFFSKASSFTHPSASQIEAQLRNYKNKNYIGFESAKMFESVNRMTFRGYDLILTLLFVGFGQSMSGDLFINKFDYEEKWPFRKGKYIAEYSKLFDYKIERKQREQIHKS